MEVLKLVPFLVIYFRYIKSQCINLTLPCQICSFAYYDSNYLNTSKISLNSNVELTEDLCLLKANSSLTRRILVSNQNCSFYDESQFENCYVNILQALQAESLISLSSLNTTLIFYLMSGNHFIIRNFLYKIDEELFRRNQINITLMPLNNSAEVKIFIKTSQFYIFICLHLTIQDIHFDGHNLEINSTVENNFCLNNDSNSCCSENDVSNSSNCAFTLVIIDPPTPNFYGLFNIEELLDVEKKIQNVPKITIVGCQFNNFFSIGWQSLIAMAPYSGFLAIHNTSFVNCFFTRGLIYFSLFVFDFLFSLYEKSQQYYSISNELILCNTSFYNDCNFNIADESKEIFSMINLMGFYGNLNISSCQFNNLFSIPYLMNIQFYEIFNFYLENILILDSSLQHLFFITNSNLFLTNITIKNVSLFQTIFVLEDCGEVFLLNFEVKNAVSNIGIIFIFINVKSSSIKQSKFYNLAIQTLINIDNANFTMSNCSLNEIRSKTLFYFSNSKLIFLNLLYFFNISSEMSLLNGLEINLFTIDICYLKNLSFKEIFFLEEIYFSLIKKLSIVQSNLTTVWATDQFSYITVCKEFVLENNQIALLMFYLIRSLYLIVNFTSGCISNNFLYDQLMVAMYVGKANFQNLSIAQNFFLNSDIFINLFDFEMDCQLLISFCIFLDNGVIEKKEFYLSKEENALIYLWNLAFSKFLNCFLIVSSQIDMASGFISGVPHYGYFGLYNSFIVIISKNCQFKYKGIIVDHFIQAELINNTFMNLASNNQSFYHSYGGIILMGSSTLSYSENNYVAYVQKNIFLNSSCLFGGAIAIVSINTVFFQNNRFYNCSSTFNAGGFLFVGGVNLFAEGLIFNNSLADIGSAFYLQQLSNAIIKNLIIFQAHSRKNAIVYTKNIDFMHISFVDASYLSSEKSGGFIYLFNVELIISHIFLYKIRATYSGGAFCIHGGSGLTSYNFTTINCISASGGVFSIENANKIELYNNVFVNSFVVGKGAALMVDFLKYLHLENIVIMESSSQSTGIIFIKTEEESSFFNFSNLTCERTFAEIGSCVYFLSSSQIKISFLKIIENGPVPLFVFWSFSILTTFENVIIQDCDTGEYLLEVWGANITFQNSIIRNNSFQSLILLQEAIAFFTNLTLFQNQKGHVFQIFSSYLILNCFSMSSNGNLSFIYSIDSNLNFSKISIYNSTSFESYFLLGQEKSLTLRNSIFFFNFGLMLKISNMNISILFSNFIQNHELQENDPNELWFINSEKSTHFINFHNNFVEVLNSFSILISGEKNLIFFSESIFNSSKLYKTNSLQIEDANEINILSCQFNNFSNGNIFSFNYDQTSFIILIINNSIFRNNFGKTGSAIYLQGNFKINIFNSLFFQNKAIKSLNSLSTFEGIAACLYLNHLVDELSEIKLISNVFLENHASFVSPLIFSQIQVKTINNTFSKNSDSLNFSDSFCSFPISFLVKDYDYPNNSIFNMTSGTPFKMEVIIQDEKKQKLVFDNETFVILNPSINKNSRNVSFSLENHIVQASMGSFIFNDLKIKTNPDTFFVFVLSGKFSGLSNPNLKVTEIQKEIVFYSRKCIIGEIILSDLRCQVCKFGTYSLIDPMQIERKYHNCIFCPLNCFCNGGNNILPNYGYFRPSNISNRCVACINSDSCLPPLDFDEVKGETFKCREGNSGSLCFYCNFNYGKYDENDYCRSCSSINGLIYIRLFIYVFILSIYVLINCHLAEKKSFANNLMFSEANTFFKIMINHSQILVIIMNINVQFPFLSWNKFIAIFDYLSMSNRSILTNDCFFQSIYFQKETNTIFKDFLNTFMPIIFSLLVFFVFYKLIFLKLQLIFLKKKKLQKTSDLTKLTLSFLFSAFLFYSLILKSSFGLFSCIKIDPDDERTFLKKSPNIQCWTFPHIYYVLILGIPAILLWGMMFPGFLFHVLRKNFSIFEISYMTGLNNFSQNFLEQNYFKIFEEKKENKTKKIWFQRKRPILYKELEKTKRASSINFKVKPKVQIKCIQDESQINWNLKIRRHSPQKGDKFKKMFDKIEKSKIFFFFSKDFKPKFCYWECLIFLRKFIFAFCCSLNEMSEGEYLFSIIIFILLSFIFITIISLPYKSNQANILELYSLTASGITIFTIMIVKIQESENFNRFSSIFCIGFNLGFYTFVILIVLIGILKNMDLRKKKKLEIDLKF